MGSIRTWVASSSASGWAWAEAAWVVFEVGLWLDRLHQRLVRIRNHVQSQELFAQVAFVADCLVIVALAARIAMESVARRVEARFPGFVCAASVTANVSACPCAHLTVDTEGSERPFNLFAHSNSSACGEHYDVGRALYELYVIMISLKVVFIGFILLPYLSENKNVGVLILIVAEMVTDHGSHSARTRHCTVHASALRRVHCVCCR